MKRPYLLLALLGILVAGVGVSYWGTDPVKRERLAPSNPESSHPEISGPSIFATLPSQAKYTQYAERIHTLGHDVPEQEQKALVVWMNSPKPAHLQDRQWHFLINGVMDSLCHQTHPLPSLSDVLIGIVRGKTNDIVLRDYAIQHFVDWIQPTHLNDPCETRPEKRQAILDAMREAAGQTKESYSGTALQCLNLILQERQRSQQQNQATAQLPFSFSIEQLRPLAVSLATGENVTDLPRITALQVSAQRGFKEILPTACTLASNPTKPASVRLSAIAAIGQLGNEEDTALLAKLEAENNRQLRKAVKTAHKAIQQRGATAITATR